MKRTTWNQLRACIEGFAQGPVGATGEVPGRRGRLHGHASSVSSIGSRSSSRHRGHAGSHEEAMSLVVLEYKRSSNGSCRMRLQ